ncbi:MAG: hypothetical protein R3D63_13160 [Paracoccaceae bacterium]
MALLRQRKRRPSKPLALMGHELALARVAVLALPTWPCCAIRRRRWCWCLAAASCPRGWRRNTALASCCPIQPCTTC